MKDTISYPGNHTEIIDPFSSKHNCKTFKVPDLPSKEGQYGMVGTYLGNGTTMFCGGTDVSTEVVAKECIRFVLQHTTKFDVRIQIYDILEMI